MSNMKPNVPQSPNKMLDYFVYAINLASLAAAASQPVTLNIEANSDFEVMKVTYYCDNTTPLDASTRVIPQISMSITDQGAGRNLSNIAFPISMWAGEGDLPYILPITKWFPRNSLFTVTLANFSSATTYSNIYVAFHGKKVWKMPS